MRRIRRRRRGLFIIITPLSHHGGRRGLLMVVQLLLRVCRLMILAVRRHDMVGIVATTDDYHLYT